MRWLIPRGVCATRSAPAGWRRSPARQTAGWRVFVEAGNEAFDRLAAKIAEHDEDRRPQNGAEDVERHKTRRRQAAGADQHRADDAETVHKAHPDNEQHRVAGDQLSGARDALFLPLEPRDDPAFEPAAGEVQQLIPQRTSQRHHRDHPRPVQQAFMGGDAAQQRDGFSLSQAADKQRPVAVVRNVVGQIGHSLLLM